MKRGTVLMVVLCMMTLIASPGIVKADMIKACVNGQTGITRIVDDHSQCKPFETHVSWNNLSLYEVSESCDMTEEPSPHDICIAMCDAGDVVTGGSCWCEECWDDTLLRQSHKLVWSHTNQVGWLCEFKNINTPDIFPATNHVTVFCADTAP